MAASTYNYEALIETHFKKGAEVEISSEDDGFRGSWYLGTIVRPVEKPKTPPKPIHGKISRKIWVEYKTLTADVAGRRALKEYIDVIQVRPLPPCEKWVVKFIIGDEVDAYYNDGWWEGIITKIENGKYSVFFRASREQLDFEGRQLRLHREWERGVWVPPLRIQSGEDNENATVVQPSPKKAEDYLSPGKSIEVSSDEEGFQGAWFAATLIRRLDNGNYLIEYKTLRNDEDTAFLREEADSPHIRPCPPEPNPNARFKVSDQVDALYHDGWWVGEIAQVHNRGRYTVYFKISNESMEFKHSDLRLHHDWIDGKWVVTL